MRRDTAPISAYLPSAIRRTKSGVFQGECVRKSKKLHEWQVIRLRANGEYLGKVLAADEEAAVKAAIKAFDLTAVEKQKQLLVRRA